MIRPAPSTWCHEDFSGEVATFGRGVTGVRMGDSVWGETFPYSRQPGLELVHERFSNRVGQPGKNIFRDRRMEFRIGITKKLIENLGPNFSDTTVQQVNHMVDVKEDLYIKTRLSHGVSIRSGRHVPRSDETDFLTLVQNLTETKAHLKIKGRRFGDFKLHEDLMNDKRFDRAKFFRWITNKNKEAKEIIEAKNAS